MGPVGRLLERRMMGPVAAGWAIWAGAHVVEATIIRTILVNVVLGGFTVWIDGETYVAEGFELCA